MGNDNNKILSSIFSVLVSGHHASCLESAAGSTLAQILVPERPSCGQQLSLALASKEELNQALAEVLKLLGLGLVEAEKRAMICWFLSGKNTTE